jgi:GTP-binding protein
MLVDFPGYGYAKKSKLHRTERVDTMQEYLTQKATIKDTLLLINAHLPPQSVDMIMLELLSDASIPYTIVFTKTDKASQKVINTNINQCKQFLQSLKVPLPTMIMTSSYKKHGLEKL